MKAFVTGLLKGRMIRWGIAVALLASAGLSVAWLGPVQYRLGGGFIGSPAGSGGISWSAYQAPLDAAGRTAALRVNTYSYGDDLAGVLAISGADTFGEGIGQAAMISRHGERHAGLLRSQAGKPATGQADLDLGRHHDIHQP